MLTLKICHGVFSGIFKAKMLKLGIHMENELLYCGIENLFIQFSFVFVFRVLRIRVTVFFATYVLLFIHIV